MKEIKKVCFEHDNKFPDSMEFGEVRDQSRNCQLLCFMYIKTFWKSKRDYSQTPPVTETAAFIRQIIYYLDLSHFYTLTG